MATLIARSIPVAGPVERALCSTAIRAATLLLACTYVVVLGITYIIFVAPGRTYVTDWLNDIMGLLDTANRFHLGQIPYKDYHLAFGPLVAVVPGLGLNLGLSAAQIFGFDSLIVSAFLLFAAVVVLPRRLTLVAAMFLFLFVWLVAAVPMGEGHYRVSWGCFYDRQAWAAILLILLFYVEPISHGRHDMWLDAVTLAALVLFACYTKFTFGAVAIGFVLASVFVSPYNRQVSLRCLAVVAAVAAALEATFHFHLAYVANIKEFLGSLKGEDRIRPAARILITNAPIALCTVGVALAPGAAGRGWRLNVLYAVACVLACVLLVMSTGHAGTSYIGLVAVFVAMGELARRSVEKHRKKTSVRSIFEKEIGALGCLFLAVAFSATESTNRLFALVDYTVHVVSRDTRLSPNPPTKLAGFIVHPVKAVSRFEDTAPSAIEAQYRNYEYIEETDYMQTITEGTRLVESVASTDQSVFTFDMVNPFPYTAGLRPPLGGHPQFWLGDHYTSDPSILPKPDEILGDADYVMVPTLPYYAEQLEIMMKIYGSALRTNYRLLKVSPHWELWARKVQ